MSRTRSDGSIECHMRLSFQGKDGGVGVAGVASEATVSSGSQKQQTQTDDDDEEDEPVYVESSPCARWQKRRETVGRPASRSTRP